MMSGVSIFANSFDYLKDKTNDIDSLYSNILLKVFNTSLAGANVHIDNLKESMESSAFELGILKITLGL